MSHREYESHVLDCIFNMDATAVVPSHTKEVARNFLKVKYNEESVDDYIEEHYSRVHEEIIKEYKRRNDENLGIPFAFYDAEGDQIMPLNPIPDAEKIITAFKEISANDFEKLGGIILSTLGYLDVYVTPESHDQGLDAFGIRKTTFGTIELDELEISILQAKHYSECEVDSADIREFIGSVILAKLKAYALKNNPYPQLEIRRFTPIQLVYLTTGRVKRTASMLCKKAGVLVISADFLSKAFPSLVTKSSVISYIDSNSSKFKQCNPSTKNRAIQ